MDAPEAMYNLGQPAKEAGDPDEARACWTGVLEFVGSGDSELLDRTRAALEALDGDDGDEE